jgi:GNAT superfamily N-acetyltransferase
VPEELLIRPLTEDDAPLINETWAYYCATTYDYVRHSILFHGGLGLVKKHDDQLISWAVGVQNTIGMVHTLPDYRNKGYAQLVITALAGKFKSENIQPVCLIKKDNIPSIKLFDKLGFKDAGLFYYITW